MWPFRFNSWLPLACLLALVAMMLGTLMLGVAGDRKGMRVLPDAVGSTVDVLDDPAGELTLEAVRAKPGEAWARWDGRGYVRSQPGGAVWLRVTLRNDRATPMRGVLADAEYYTDRIDLWTREDREWNALSPTRFSGGVPEQRLEDKSLHPEANWTHQRAGEWVPAAEKPIWGRDAGFFVDVPAEGERTVYLRVQDRFGAWLRLVWWPDARAFLSSQLRDTMAEAAYFGILLALVVYNGVLWARLRFRDIGYYLGYLGSVAVFMFISRVQHPLVGWAAGSPVTETILTCALGASGFFVAQFARTFLELEARVKVADWIVRVVGLAMAALAVGALAFPWMTTTIWLHFAVAGAALAHTVLLASAIAAWRAGSYHARFFVLSFGLLLAGVVPTAIIWLLAIPLGMSAMAMMLGSALEMLLLSLAIADRFARLQQDKIVAQARAVEEAERRRVMQDAYADELEHEVRERTRELRAANADKDRMMAVLGHDLRSPLTSLTLAAEQAAGTEAKTARGFAADAAQTGRALLLLLEDVVLWARLRAGTGRPGDHGAMAIVAPAVDMHRAGAAQRGVMLEVNVAPELTVRADLVLAQTLVRNLTSNAVKAARTRVVVSAVGDAVAGHGRVSVRDDGAGLPAAVKEQFARGVAAESGSNSPWGGRSGLGLRLCVEIAQAIGTRLEAGEAPGGGVEISFTLPRAET